jgi:hypothetical protein
MGDVCDRQADVAFSLRVAAPITDPHPLGDALVDPPRGEREEGQRDAAEQRRLDDLKRPEMACRVVRVLAVVAYLREAPATSSGADPG